MTTTFYLPLTNYLIHTQEVQTIDDLHNLAHQILDEFNLKTVRVITENDDFTINLPPNYYISNLDSV